MDTALPILSADPANHSPLLPQPPRTETPCIAGKSVALPDSPESGLVSGREYGSPCRACLPLRHTPGCCKSSGRPGEAGFFALTHVEDTRRTRLRIEFERRGTGIAEEEVCQSNSLRKLGFVTTTPCGK